MSEKASEKSEMTDCTVASNLMRELAPAGTAKARIGVVATKLRWPWSRAKAIWYGEARRIDAGEMDALRAAIRKRQIEEGRREFAELRAQIARLETAIIVANPTMDRDTLDAVLKTIRGPGGVDRAGADGGGE